VAGLYRAPVFSSSRIGIVPPQTIISLPVQTAVCCCRSSGALASVVAVHVSVVGLYLAPVFTGMASPSSPPQIIISLPVQTAV
jgi:hypothetical protein